jgi:hypothetical protein
MRVILIDHRQLKPKPKSIEHLIKENSSYTIHQHKSFKTIHSRHHCMSSTDIAAAAADADDDAARSARKFSFIYLQN